MTCILGALVALALLTLPTVFDQPNLGADAVILDNTKILDADLTKADGSTTSISELLAGNEALIIGLVLPGSEQILTQANEFNRSIDQLGDRVEVAPSDYARDETVGELVSLDKNQIVMSRTQDSGHAIYLHFPRKGFELRRL